MSYNVIWKTVGNNATLRTETYENLDDAIEEAGVQLIGGPNEVQIVVQDAGGQTIYRSTAGSVGPDLT